VKRCAYCGERRPSHRATCPSPRREADSLLRGIDGPFGVREGNALTRPLALLRTKAAAVLRVVLAGCGERAGERGGQTPGSLDGQTRPRDDCGSRIRGPFGDSTIRMVNDHD
jgi:hypothetical protein